MESVFISYAREDVRIADQIAHFLTGSGFIIWRDTSDLRPGQRYVDVIDEALHEVDHVVVVWSPEAVMSHWVLDEAAVGRDRGVLIPVAIGGAEPPLGFRHLHTPQLARQVDDEELDVVFSGLLAARGPVAAPGAGVRSFVRRCRRVGRRHPVIYTLIAACGLGSLGLASWDLLRPPEVPAAVLEARRQVTLVGLPGAPDAFRMSSSEITNAEYHACVLAGVCTPPSGTEDVIDYTALSNAARAVTNMTALQARVFCGWTGGDLPTFEQWKTAAARVFGSETADPRVLRVELPAQPDGIPPNALRNVIGNFAEWSRTSCDRSACAATPRGVELQGPLRILGYAWSEIPDTGLPSDRAWLEESNFPPRLQLADFGDSTVSFRCVYETK